MIASKVSTELEGIDLILDAVMILFRIDFTGLNIWEWFRRKIVTKKWILKNVSYEELNGFVEAALEPILGDKKKNGITEKR